MRGLVPNEHLGRPGIRLLGMNRPPTRDFFGRIGRARERLGDERHIRITHKHLRPHICAEQEKLLVCIQVKPARRVINPEYEMGGGRRTRKRRLAKKSTRKHRRSKRYITRGSMKYQS